MVLRTNLHQTHTRSRSGSARASIREIDDKHLMQQVKQADIFHSETASDFERFQMVGITAVPLKQAKSDQQNQNKSQQQGGDKEPKAGNWNHDQPKGKSAEAVMLYLNGDRNHPIALIDDRRVRPYAMKEGESAMYAASGTGQMLFHDDKGSYLVVVNNAAEQAESNDEVERFTSVRHVVKSKQTREIKEGQNVPDHKHEGEKVNLESRTTKDKLQSRDGDNGVVSVYDKTKKSWTHQILANSDDATNPNADPNTAPAGGDVANQLSGMISQASSLNSAGVGLPGIQGIGSQIAGMGSDITGAGGSSGIASSITTLGTQLSTALSGGVSSILSSLTGQLSSLTSMLNPGGTMSKVLHSHILDKAKGVATSAFNGDHTTTWDQNGVNHTSKSKVSSTAPNLPHNGEVYNSDNVHTSLSSYAAAFPVVSDVRLKQNIYDHPSVLDKVMKLQVKAFDVSSVNWETGAKHSAPPRPSVGLLAQDVQQIFPQLVHGDKFLAVEEGKIGLLVLAAFQEFVTEVREELKGLKAT